MAGADMDSVGVPKLISDGVIVGDTVTFTVPVGKLWRLIAFTGTYSSVAGGAGRTISMQATPDGSGETIVVEAAVDQIPAVQRAYFFSPDVPSSVAFDPGVGVQIPTLLLHQNAAGSSQGDVLFTATNDEAGDTWVGPLLHVVEYGVRPN